MLPWWAPIASNSVVFVFFLLFKRKFKTLSLLALMLMIVFASLTYQEVYPQYFTTARTTAWAVGLSIGVMFLIIEYIGGLKGMTKLGFPVLILFLAIFLIELQTVFPFLTGIYSVFFRKEKDQRL